MSNHPGCRVPSSPRWQPNYNNHFNGCRGGTEEHLRSELAIRDAHLVECGAVEGSAPAPGERPDAAAHAAPQSPASPRAASEDSPAAEAQRAGPAGTLDLSGVWVSAAGPAGAAAHRPQRILVFQLGRTLQFYNIAGRRWIWPGMQFLTAVVPAAPPPVRFAADVRTANADGSLYWPRTTVTVTDADHLRIGDEPAFQRASSRPVRELPCKEDNPQHVAADEAFLRAQAYWLLNDQPTSTCWYRIGALGGDARAEASYAAALARGTGIAPDLDQAELWARRSAAQHNAYGESALIEVGKKRTGGVGLPANEPVAVRYLLHDPRRAYTGDPTEAPATARPGFIADPYYSYVLAGEWKLQYPPGVPGRRAFTVVVLQKGRDLQLIVGDPNVDYPIGESLFNGRYQQGRIVGDLMDAPAHKGDGYRGFAWSKAEVGISDPATLVLPGQLTLRRVRGPVVANRLCDAAREAHLDPGTALQFAKADYSVENHGNAACWLYVSASQGNPDAALALGLVLRLGVGVSRNEQQAFAWFRRAADADLFDAERIVAQSYASGAGTHKDAELAQLWTREVERRLALARQEAAARQLEAAEQAQLAAQLGLIGGVLGLDPGTRDEQMAAMVRRGMTSAQAEAAVGPSPTEEMFMQGLLGQLFPDYQPPAPPPSR